MITFFLFELMLYQIIAVTGEIIENSLSEVHFQSCDMYQHNVLQLDDKIKMLYAMRLCLFFTLTIIARLPHDQFSVLLFKIIHTNLEI